MVQDRSRSPLVDSNVDEASDGSLNIHHKAPQRMTEQGNSPSTRSFLPSIPTNRAYLVRFFGGHMQAVLIVQTGLLKIILGKSISGMRNLQTHSDLVVGSGVGVLQRQWQRRSGPLSERKNNTFFLSFWLAAIGQICTSFRVNQSTVHNLVWAPWV